MRHRAHGVFFSDQPGRLSSFCRQMCSNQHGRWRSVASDDNVQRHADTTALTLTINEDLVMLYTIAVILLILWVLGLVTSYTVGGLVHILLVVAVIMILVRLISGRGL